MKLWKRIGAIALLTAVLSAGAAAEEGKNGAVPATAALSEPNVSAESAVLIEADSGEVVYQKAADRSMAMASTTKIMTAYVAITQGDVTSEICVSPGAVGVEGSSIYLYQGEKLTLEALLYAMMLESANDAAAAIALHFDETVADFACRMNEAAAALGLENTHFTNPHGLYDEDHYTTARDLAALARAALENETFRKIVSTYKHTIPLKAGEGTRMLINHNKLLKSYDGCIGVKTGFTKKSGRCLVTAAERQGVRLIAVTLRAPDDWNDHKKMLDYGFSLYEGIELAAAGDFSYRLPVVGGKQETVSVCNPEGVRLVRRKGQGEITHRVELRQFYYAPLEAGQELGRVVFYAEGNEIAAVPLTAAESVMKQEKPLTLFGRFKRWLNRIFS